MRFVLGTDDDHDTHGNLDNLEYRVHRLVGRIVGPGRHLGREQDRGRVLVVDNSNNPFIQSQSVGLLFI